VLFIPCPGCGDDTTFTNAPHKPIDCKNCGATYGVGLMEGKIILVRVGYRVKPRRKYKPKPPPSENKRQNRRKAW
jgi:hypothetical protein